MEELFMDKKNYIYHILYSTIILLLISFCGCNTNNQIIRGENMIPTHTNTKEMLFRMIFNHPDLKQYYHEEVKNRVPVIIKTDDTLDSKMNITLFNVPVQFITNNKNLSEGTPFFNMNSFNLKEDEAIFDIAYKIEGILIKGKIIKEKNGWRFKEYDIIEK